MRDIFGLGTDPDALLMLSDELEYEYNFDIDQYIIVAQIMLKMDLNLKKSRHEFVPEMISEDNFWRNYFYRIECMKRDQGLVTKLGKRIVQGPVAAVDQT